MTARKGSFTSRIAVLVGAVVLAAVAVPGAAAVSGPSTDPALGFLLDRDRVRSFEVPGGDRRDVALTALIGINNRGRIVGKAPDLDGVGNDGIVGDRSRRVPGSRRRLPRIPVEEGPL